MDFWKYQATGNDFILLDGRQVKALGVDQISRLCDRHYGIGADGVMIVKPSSDSNSGADFQLDYFNSDGSSSLCGNGSRAAVAFARFLGLINTETTFLAYDGLHQAVVLPDGNIRLKMNDVQKIHTLPEGEFLHTGSPHLIRYVPHIDLQNVAGEGRAYRNHIAFKPGGTNVNFVELRRDDIQVRTYERGVEAETESCGTGVTAAALAVSLKGYTSPVRVQTRGGVLLVEFQISQNGTFTEIYLTGPAKMVFSGHLDL